MAIVAGMAPLLAAQRPALVQLEPAGGARIGSRERGPWAVLLGADALEEETERRRERAEERLERLAET